MQFDKTLIAVRERSYLDLLDLALRVVQAHAAPLLATVALGSLPMALLNVWLLGGSFYEENLGELAADDPISGMFEFGFYLAWLIVWEMPLAAAPTTLYLGVALFHEKPSPRQLARDFVRSLPQLLLCQVLLRALCVPLVVTWFVLFAIWPYLNEIILLERNPLFSRKKSKLLTFQRSSNLHTANSGELFSRWILAGLVGTAMTVALWLSIWFLRWQLTNNMEFDRAMFTIYLQVALWIVLGYFTVVRFLSYLDLRIKSEGWEVELRMRAEAARLSRVG